MQVLRIEEPPVDRLMSSVDVPRDVRPVRVYVVAGGGPIFRRGVAAVLATEPGLRWVGEAHDGAEAALKAPQAAPDVVLVDADLADIDSITLVGGLRRTLPRARFVLLAEVPSTALQARAAAVGASALVHKGASTQELIAAVHGAFRAAGIAPAASWVAAARRDPQPGDDLTRRERDLLELMGRGMSNQEISSRLDIALPTVKFHVTNILAKLNADNRTAAVLVALRHKLVALN
jgi:NarL family two-component system response regulator LiaR